MKKIICKYHQNHCCKFGEKCNSSHDIEISSNISPNKQTTKKIKTVFSSYEDNQATKAKIIPSTATIDNNDILFNLDSLNLCSINSKGTICPKFLQGDCLDEDCQFFHGYSDTLMHISNIPCHTNEIVSLCTINQSKFASCDQSTVKIWKIEEKLKCIGECSIKKGKITHMISANNQLFFVVHHNQIFNENPLLYTLIESHLSSRPCTMEKINDIIYYKNMIMCFGTKAIEAFQISEGELVFIKHINIVSEIISVITINRCIFTGHFDGQITILSLDSTNFFRQVSIVLGHSSKVNTMIIKTVNSDSNYLISGSEDRNIKVFNIENGMGVIFSRVYSFPITNIISVIDGENKELFCVSFSSGLICVLNNAFETLFDIPPVLINKMRFCINVINPEKNETDGHFIIINNGKSIECNMWITPGAYQKINKIEDEDKNENNFLEELNEI